MNVSRALCPDGGHPIQVRIARRPHGRRLVQRIGGDPIAERSRDIEYPDVALARDGIAAIDGDPPAIVRQPRRVIVGWRREPAQVVTRAVDPGQLGQTRAGGTAQVDDIAGCGYREEGAAEPGVVHDLVHHLHGRTGQLHGSRVERLLPERAVAPVEQPPGRCVLDGRNPRQQQLGRCPAVEGSGVNTIARALQQLAHKRGEQIVPPIRKQHGPAGGPRGYRFRTVQDTGALTAGRRHALDSLALALRKQDEAIPRPHAAGGESDRGKHLRGASGHADAPQLTAREVAEVASVR